MRKLTTRQKFALSFSLYVFILLIVIFTLFFLVFHFAINYQITRELSSATLEIINDHLTLSNNTIDFKLDPAGITLREYLVNNGFSAVILNRQNLVLRAYGLFTLDNKSQNTNQNRFLSLASQTQDTKTERTTEFSWGGQPTLVRVTPLKSSGDVVGTMILGRTLEEYQNINGIMLTVFATLGVVNLAGSFLIGFLLARKAFFPLRKMIGVIEEIDLERLDKSIIVEGNPHDEVVLLSQKFNDMFVRLKDMSGRQKEFIANVSHELRTPLTRAISSLELLSPDSPEYDHEMELIKEDLFHINSLLENLLALTKLKRDIQTPYRKHTINLGKLFLKIQKVLEVKILEKKLNIIKNIHAIIEATLPEDYLEIIFSNILTNAVKYTAYGKSIYISSSQSVHETILEIRDEGIGMDEQETVNIFHRFYRISDRTFKETGYGIGLSLVKQICDLYHIPIMVTSNKDQGTSISLHFINEDKQR